MLIDCPNCDAKVHPKLLAERVYPPTDDYELFKILFLECPSCENVLLGSSYYDDNSAYHGKDPWSVPSRLWPEPPKSFGFDVPNLVGDSIEEACKCVQCEAYSASAVMCGKAIEAICRDKTGETTLHKGLKKLKDNNIIDDRLYDWGEALRNERNMGAHATEKKITKEDAKDILDFATAIIEYIYIMTAQFEAYKNRKTNV